MISTVILFFFIGIRTTVLLLEGRARSQGGACVEATMAKASSADFRSGHSHHACLASV